MQRLTALYLGVFMMGVGGLLLFAPPEDDAVWRGWVQNGPARLAFGIFIVALLVHAWIGMRSVWLDYLQSAVIRVVASALTALMLLVAGLWAADILIRAGA